MRIPDDSPRPQHQPTRELPMLEEGIHYKQPNTSFQSTGRTLAHTSLTPSELTSYLAVPPHLLGTSDSSCCPQDASMNLHTPAGALRPGGRVDLLAWHNIGLLVNYFAVGTFNGVFPAIVYPLFKIYLDEQGYQSNATSSLLSFAWYLKFPLGFISDCVPINGYRRKPYMYIGWVFLIAVMSYVTMMPQVEPYKRHGVVVNETASSHGPQYIIPLMTASIGYLLTDVACDGLMVEYAHRESDLTRGTTQTMVYGVRFTAELLGTLVVAVGLNSDEFGGDFKHAMPLWVLFGFLTLVSVLALVASKFNLQDQRVIGKPLRYQARGVWRIIQSRATWQIVVYGFIQFFTFAFDVSPSNTINEVWLHIDPFSNSLFYCINSGVYATATFLMRRYFLNTNWRTLMVMSILCGSLIGLPCVLITVFNVYRNKCFYLDKDQVISFFDALAMMVRLVVIVEIAEPGLESSTYSLVTTVYNLAIPVMTTTSNLLGTGFKMHESLRRSCPTCCRSLRARRASTLPAATAAAEHRSARLHHHRKLYCSKLGVRTETPTATTGTGNITDHLGLHFHSVTSTSTHTFDQSTSFIRYFQPIKALQANLSVPSLSLTENGRERTMDMDDTCDPRAHTARPTDRAAPLPSLSALKHAVSSAFDDEIALWTRAAGNYRQKLARETLHHEGKLEPPRAPQVTLDDEDDHISVSTQGTHSRSSSASETSSVVGGDASIQAKWDALETILAGLKPPRRPRPRVAMETRGRVQNLQADIEKLRRRAVSSDRNRGVAVTNSTCRARQPRKPVDPQACHRVFLAWIEFVRYRRWLRTRTLAAEVHSKRRIQVSLLKKWCLYCMTRQSDRSQASELTHAVHSLVVRRILSRWWTSWRWKRGFARLNQWSSWVRRRRSFLQWCEVVVLAKSVRRLRDRVNRRAQETALDQWRLWLLVQRKKTEMKNTVDTLILRRWFGRLRTGCHGLRHRSWLKKTASNHRQVHALRKLFVEWCRYTEERHRSRLALEWWRHCAMTSCFAVWGLFHRATKYRHYLYGCASSCYATILARRALLTWRGWVRRRQRLRSLLVKIEVHRVTREVIGRLRDAVEAERDLNLRLLNWRVRRCISLWHTTSQRRASLIVRRDAVKSNRGRHLVARFAWPTWRASFRAKRREQRLLQQATRHELRKWWKRWRNFDSITKAEYAMHVIIDAERNRRNQRRTIRRWRGYCVQSRIQTERLRICDSRYNSSIVTSCLKAWRRFVQHRHNRRELWIQAQRLFTRHVLRSWRTRVIASIDLTVRQVVRLKALHQACTKRFWLRIWDQRVKSAVRARQRRLLLKWRRYVFLVCRDRALECIRDSMRMRRVFTAWKNEVAACKHYQLLQEQIKARSSHVLLRRALVSIWLEKARRNISARAIIFKLIEKHQKRVWLQQWKKRSNQQRNCRKAAAFHVQRARARVFHQWFEITIIRPRKVVHLHRQTVLAQCFNRWKQSWRRRKQVENATDQFLRHRQHKVVHRWLGLVLQRCHRDDTNRRAVAYFRRTQLGRCFGAWLALTNRRSHCKTAVQTLITTAQRQHLDRWRRALARQVYIRGLERKYELAWQQQVWRRFVDGVARQQHARHVWLTRLNTLLVVKTFRRWCEFIKCRSEMNVQAARLRQRTQQQRRRVCFDAWNRYVAIRAFVALRDHRVARKLVAEAMHQWKLHTAMMFMLQGRLWKTARRVFGGLKRHVDRQRVVAHVVVTSKQRLIRDAWQAWRVEYWVKRSQCISQSGLIRRCFQSWKEIVTKSAAANHPGLSDSGDDHPVSSHLLPPHGTSFQEAMALQKAVHRQRQMMAGVLGAWALAARTRKRQRRRQCARQSISMGTGMIHDENADPNSNTPTAKYRSLKPRRRIAATSSSEIAAMEHWATTLMQSCFTRWYLHTQQRKGKSSV